MTKPGSIASYGPGESRPLLSKPLILNQTAAAETHHHNDDHAAAETSHHHNDDHDDAAAASDAQRRLATGLKFALVWNPATRSLLTARLWLQLINMVSTASSYIGSLTRRPLLSLPV